MRQWLIIGLVLLLNGCGISIQGNQYEQQTPKFDLMEFFNGEMKGWGIVQDRSGNVIQQFTVDLLGEMSDDSTLVLSETFRYQLGQGVQRRQWVITKQLDNSFQGNADDIIGNANGKVFGSAATWQYEMNLPVAGSTYHVTFDDWMWQFDDGAVINRSYIKKFGLVFAEVTLFFQKNNDCTKAKGAVESC